MIHLYVRHDSFIRSMTHFHVERDPLFQGWGSGDMTHSYVVCLIYIKAMTHSFAGHVSFICGMGFTHSYVGHDSFIRGMSHLYKGHDTFICGTFPIYLWNATYFSKNVDEVT